MTSGSTNVAALRALIAQASSSQVEVALNKSLNASPGVWMSRRQKYADGGSRRALSRTHPLPAKTASSMLEYAAASVFLHAADSWSLIGRAMAAFAAGDVPIAQHLLYYSELRAAQSILARQGIVLLDKNPYCYLHDGRTVGLRAALGNPATHQATWDVFSAWSDEHAADFIGGCIRVDAHSASEWSAARPSPIALSTAVPDLIKRWGLDLNLMRGDRDLRNSVSYEPSRIVPWVGPVAPSVVARGYREMWEVLEPVGSSGFDSFDRRLLRQILQVSYSATHGMPTTKSKRFAMDVRSTISNLGIYDPRGILADFLTTPEPQEDLFRFASKAPAERPRSSAEEFFSMRGRALILGRFALGAARGLLDASGAGPEQISFWADDFLTLHGVDHAHADGYAELWDETAMALEDMEPMELLANPSDKPRTREWAEPLHLLSSLERVAAWAVA